MPLWGWIITAIFCINVTFVLDRNAYNESRRKSGIIAEYIKQSHIRKEKAK